MTKVVHPVRGRTWPCSSSTNNLKRLPHRFLDLWRSTSHLRHEPDLATRCACLGALEQPTQGKVLVGFTGHQGPSIHLGMLAQDFPFDAVQIR